VSAGGDCLGTQAFCIEWRSKIPSFSFANVYLQNPENLFQPLASITVLWTLLRNLSIANPFILRIRSRYASRYLLSYSPLYVHDITGAKCLVSPGSGLPHHYSYVIRVCPHPQLAYLNWTSFTSNRSLLHSVPDAATCCDSVTFGFAIHTVLLRLGMFIRKALSGLSGSRN